ncbi:hypothetical protein FQN54_007875 [Arachnomyces sp. PD_36]|nr:hypothetical protein FQN54_007875 [Arachnomyces sp. PD_36]
MGPPSQDDDENSQTISPNSNSIIDNPDNSLLEPMKDDDLSHDWAQWMQWDEQDPVDSISDHVDGSISSRNLSWDESQLMKSLEREAKIPLLPTSPANGRMPQQQTACPSAISPVSMGHLDVSLGQAMYSGTGPRGATVTPNEMTTGGGLGSPVSPQSIVPANRKRKSSSEDGAGGADFDSKKLPSKKRSHNVIEKRYRANLNEKIAELRDSVPSLRVAASTQRGGTSLDDDEQGTAPANKLNKASILSKATAYIQHLELRNRRLDEENLALKARLRQLDKALDQNVTATSSGSISSPDNCTISTESGTGSSPSVFSHVEETSPCDSTPNPLYPPEGLLKVPEYFKRFHAKTEPQPHYADTQVEYENSESERSPGGGGKRRRGKFPNKFMVGALAGIMVVEGLGKQRQTESTEKGLFAIPFHLLKGFIPSARSIQYAFFSSRHLWALFGFGITFGFIFSLAFLVFLYLFNSRPRRQKNTSKGAGVVSGSSNEFRQRAWLTSIQTVGVPSHTFFPEWFAVTSRCFEYCLRRALGWGLYSWLTGITEEDEKGRVKTWDIAIDAQLTGGDPEITKSRLVLTIFASGTLPASPARLMLKALHCRILLYMVGSPGSFSFVTSNKFAGMLARYQWNLARQLHESWPEDDPELLPPHLAALLRVESDDVMIDTITQRAMNMTWSRPTQEATQGEEALLDVVAEDTSIRSPLDALAAWWSSHNLQKGLVGLLGSQSSFPPDTETQKSLQSSIDAAINTAPPTSSPYTRALAAKAIFSDENRSKNISSVLAALPTAKDRSNNLPPNPCKSINFVDSSTPVSIRSEIGLAARCAIITAILKRESMRDVALPASKAKRKAIALFNEFPLDPVDLTLLGFVSIFYLLHVVASDELRIPSQSDSSPSNNTSSTDDDEKTELLSKTRSTDTLKNTRPIPQLDRVASGLVYWIRNAYGPASYGFTADLVKKVETECHTVCSSVGIELVLDEKKKGKMKSKSRSKSKAKTGREEIKEDPNLERTRRESMRSNDTGYGSLGEGDGGVQEQAQSLDRIDDIDQG